MLEGVRRSLFVDAVQYCNGVVKDGLNSLCETLLKFKSSLCVYVCV